MPPDADAPGMVLVPGGRYSVGVAQAVDLPDFWIDQHEVTNASFKRFVDAGGYRDPKYWKAPFRDGRSRADVRRGDGAVPRSDGPDRARRLGARQLSGRPGGLPVGGISWFEAAAYAEFAGKSLPTIYHWYPRGRAPTTSSRTSCASATSTARAPARAGERRGLGPWGTVDMARQRQGMVPERPSKAGACATSSAAAGTSRTTVSATRRRAIPGSGSRRSACAWSRTSAPPSTPRRPSRASTAIRIVAGAGRRRASSRSSSASTPTNRSPLNARVDSVDDSSPHWKKETVSFDAAYGGERIPAYLFLPKNVAPPYQTIVLFPNAYARIVTSSQHLDLRARSSSSFAADGRCCIPVYKGTFERGGGQPPQGGRARHARPVGEGLLPRGRLPRNAAGRRQSASSRTTA